MKGLHHGSHNNNNPDKHCMTEDFAKDLLLISSNETFTKQTNHNINANFHKISKVLVN